MATEALYYSSKDGLEKALANPETLMFTSKKEADERDRALDFALNFAEFMKGCGAEYDTEMLEEIGLKVAEHQKTITQGLKKPDALLEALDGGQSSGEQSNSGAGQPSETQEAGGHDSEAA